MKPALWFLFVAAFPGAIPSARAVTITGFTATAGARWTVTPTDPLTLSAPATVRGLLVKSAAGTNPFTLSDSALTLGVTGLRDKDADMLTINNPITLSCNLTGTGSVALLGVPNPQY